MSRLTTDVQEFKSSFKLVISQVSAKGASRLTHTFAHTLGPPRPRLTPKPEACPLVRVWARGASGRGMSKVRTGCFSPAVKSDLPRKTLPENSDKSLCRPYLPRASSRAWPRSAWPTDRKASDSSAEFLMSFLHPPLPTLSLTPQQALGGIARLSFF